MGDGSDASDIDRLMRSPEGSAYLDWIRRSMLGKRIDNVEFTNDTHAIKAVVRFSGGGMFVAYPPELDIAVLQNTFGEVIERERQTRVTKPKPTAPSP